MINSAIVGLGKMGLSHCSILNANPDANMGAVCDSSTFLLEAFNKYTKKRTYTDYKKMLEENSINTLIIATPTKYHYDMVNFALEKGIHVFCEKPFTLKLEEAEKLVKLAREKKVVNQVGYHNRFIGTFREVKRLIEKNVIGELYHFQGEAYGPVVLKEKGSTWRSNKNEGGGCLYDYSSHVINLINFIIGVPRKVKGTLLKSVFSNGVEDAVYSALVMENGLSGLLLVNWSDETYRKMSTSITLFGKKGKIVCDAHELKIYLNYENKEEKLDKGWNIKYITDLTEPVNFYLRGEEYSSQIDYFIDNIKKSKLENINSFESAMETDKVIDMLVKDGEGI
jgi:predicted dehydrogenase